MGSALALVLSTFAIGAEAPRSDYVMSKAGYVESIYGIPLTPEFVSLIRISDNDRGYAQKLRPKVVAILKTYLKTRPGRLELSAARKIGDFILVFYEAPELDDGGLKLVYSLKENRVLSYCIGDYRG